MSARSKVSAIILAAGLSRRTSPRNKLLLPWQGATVIRTTVLAVLGSGFAEVIVVTGHAREPVERAVNDLATKTVHAADFAGGMGHSLAAGIRAAAGGASGYAVIPGDLPSLSSLTIEKIMLRFSELGASRHVIPTTRGERGHPVILGAWLRPELEVLAGDSGARDLLARPRERARCDFFEIGDPAIRQDVDTLPDTAPVEFDEPRPQPGS